MARLYFYSKHEHEMFDRIVLGEREITLGRGRTCNVLLPDAHVSRVHAVIRPCSPPGQSGKRCYEIEDLSTNGTRVNGERVSGVERLYPGDRIEIENFVILHETDDVRPPQSVSA